MALLGLAAWMSYIRVFSAEPAQDWMVFYTAARGWLAGDPALLIDGQQLTDAINQRFSTWLAIPLHLHPWVYPPSFLLLFLPFAVPPPTASLVLFELAGLPAFLAAVSASFAAPRSRTIAIAALLLCPAAPFNAMTGQNALFTSALLVGGFAVLDRRPILAGVLLGLLSFKPQLWLMAPVALVAARRWRVLASMAAAALALAFASLAVFGADAWRAWLALMTGADDRFSAWQAAGRLGGMSMFASVRLLGAPEALASLLQLAATALAGIAVYGIFRRRAAGMLAGRRPVRGDDAGGAARLDLGRRVAGDRGLLVPLQSAGGRAPAFRRVACRRSLGMPADQPAGGVSRRRRHAAAGHRISRPRRSPSCRRAPPRRRRRPNFVIGRGRKRRHPPRA